MSSSLSYMIHVLNQEINSQIGDLDNGYDDVDGLRYRFFDIIDYLYIDASLEECVILDQILEGIDTISEKDYDNFLISFLDSLNTFSEEVILDNLKLDHIMGTKLA